MIAFISLVFASRMLVTRVPIGVRITASSYDGVLVSADRDTAAAWEATPANVEEAESALATLFKGPAYKRTRLSRELPRYKRQYWPVLRGNRKVLLIFGFHETQKPASTRDWLNQVCSVAGGGDYFFRAEYDFAARKAVGGPNGPK